MCLQDALVLACSLTLPPASTLYTAAPEVLGYTVAPEAQIYCNLRDSDTLQPGILGYTVAPGLDILWPQKLGYTIALVLSTL